MVLISHNHYDHLDLESVQKLEARFKSSGIRWFVPIGLKSWMVSNAGCSEDRVTELSWGDSVAVKGSFQVHCLPAQHWSMRNPLTDKFKVNFTQS